MPDYEGRLWWEEFTDEERAELEAWLAEVNTLNDKLAPYEDGGPGRDTEGVTTPSTP